MGSGSKCLQREASEERATKGPASPMSLPRLRALSLVLGAGFPLLPCMPPVPCLLSSCLSSLRSCRLSNPTAFAGPDVFLSLPSLPSWQQAKPQKPAVAGYSSRGHCPGPFLLRHLRDKLCHFSFCLIFKAPIGTAWGLVLILPSGEQILLCEASSKTWMGRGGLRKEKTRSVSHSVAFSLRVFYRLLQCPHGFGLLTWRGTPSPAPHWPSLDLVGFFV